MFVCMQYTYEYDMYTCIKTYLNSSEYATMVIFAQICTKPLQIQLIAKLFLHICKNISAQLHIHIHTHSHYYTHTHLRRSLRISLKVFKYKCVFTHTPLLAHTKTTKNSRTYTYRIGNANDSLKNLRNAHWQ